MLDDLVGQPELRDAVRQHATGQVQGLVDRHVVTAAGQLAGRRQAAWAGPDDGHALAGSLEDGRLVLRLPAGPVGDEPLEVTDGDRCTLAPPDALGLALVLLRADPTSHSRQGVVGEEHARGFGEVAGLDAPDERGDVDDHRATLDARRPLARKAPLRLEHRERAR